MNDRFADPGSNAQDLTNTAVMDRPIGVLGSPVRGRIEEALALATDMEPIVIGRGGAPVSRPYFEMYKPTPGAEPVLAGAVSPGIDNPTVSARHATITFSVDRRKYLVQDGAEGPDGVWVPSKNGTFVQVPGGGTLPLSDHKILSEWMPNGSYEIDQEGRLWLAPNVRIHLSTDGVTSFLLPRTDVYGRPAFRQLADEIALDRPVALCGVEFQETVQQTAHGTVAMLSSKGVNYKEINQDSALTLSTRKGTFLFVLDGIGGMSEGERASERAVISLSDDLLLGMRLGGAINFVSTRFGTERATELTRAATLREQPNYPRNIGSTVVGVRIQKTSAQYGNLGDSVGMQIRGGREVFRTREHNLSRDYAAAKRSELKVDQTEQLPANVLANVLSLHAMDHIVTRVAGIKDGAIAEERCDVSKKQELRAGDTIILGSDGLWKFVTKEEVLKLSKDSKDPEELARELFELATGRMEKSKRGDNITIVVYRHAPRDIDALLSN